MLKNNAEDIKITGGRLNIFEKQKQISSLMPYTITCLT